MTSANETAESVIASVLDKINDKSADYVGPVLANIDADKCNG